MTTRSYTRAYNPPSRRLALLTGVLLALALGLGAILVGAPFSRLAGG